VWDPIRDGIPAPGIDWLRRQVEFIDGQRKAGLTAYVHCRNGVSRSGLVVTAYVMYENHWTLDRALAFVRSKRPIARPNRAFMKRLSEWERVLLDPTLAKGKGRGKQPR
jgi:protein-tyrosine phosphatase